ANTGEGYINITNLSFYAYSKEAVKILDVYAIRGNVTAGLETSERLFNISVAIGNSLNSAYSATLWLNISNSTNVVNYTSKSISVPARDTIVVNFTEVNTSTWNQGGYAMRAYLDYGLTTEMVKPLTFRNIAFAVRTSAYICNGTTESYNITIFHPFTDFVVYNVSLNVPSGWSFTPSSQVINASSYGNYTLTFNITSGQASANLSVNATINYTYPSMQKQRIANYSIENGMIPIIDIVRETPKLMGRDTVFDSQLSVHNKGCATSESVTIKEVLSSGWTPANPSIRDNEYTTDYGRPVSLTSSSTDLINNIVSWGLGAIEANEYAVLTYQVKSSGSLSTPGSLVYNASWGNRFLREYSPYAISTMNYTSESHLEFDLIAMQLAAFPWSEPRSVQPNKSYNYSLKIVNVGDAATGTNWNASLVLPNTCNVTYIHESASGNWNEFNRTLQWNLSNIAVYDSLYLNFTVNCTTSARNTFYARGFRDTRNSTYVLNDTNIGCSSSSSSCSSTNSYTFSKPTNARYEKLSEVDFYVNYSWSGINLSIGEGGINFSDDYNVRRIAWQNFSFKDANGRLWSNYSIDSGEQERFGLASRSIGVYASANGTYNANANVSVEKLGYTWQTGKFFDERQALYATTKIYVYNTLMQNATLLIGGNRTKTTGGWGEEFNFTVQVRDRFSRNVTIFAWHKPSSAAEYALLPNDTANVTCANCDTTFQTINFTYDYQPNSGNLTSWTFKFNASNPDGNEELDGFSYTVEKDDIDIVNTTPGQNITVNRSAFTSVFSARAFDRDNSTYPVGAAGKIFLDAFAYGSYESSPPSTTSADGSINRTMQGGDGTDKAVYWCSDTSKWYLGIHSWYGATSGDNFYKDNSTTAINFTLKGDLSNSTMTAFSANYTRGVSISFTGSVKDDCSTSQIDQTKFGLVFRMVRGGTAYGNCTTPTDSYTCSIATDSSFPYGNYNITMVSFGRGGEVENYWNGTRNTENAFFLRSDILLDAAQKIPSGASTPWGKSPFNFSVNISSGDNENVTVYLWVKNATTSYQVENQTSCTSCGNFTFLTRRIVTNNSIAGNTWTWKFNATSSTANTNNTLAEQTFDVAQDQVDFRFFIGNNTNVTRSSVISPFTNLTAVIWDLVLSQNTLLTNTSNVSMNEVHFYVFNGTNYQENTTEVTRNHTSYWRSFNPDCSFSSGQQVWNVSVAGNQAYANNITNSYTSLVVNVIGDLNATYASPLGLAEYERGTSITLSGNVSDDCLRGVSDATVMFNLTNGINAYLCTSSSSSNPYTCSQDTSSMVVGAYNVTMMANKSYNNNATNFSLNALRVKSTAALIKADVSPRADGWAPRIVRVFSVNVTDNSGDTVTVRLYQRHSTITGNDWQQINTSRECTSCTNTTLNWTTSYAATNVSTNPWEFKFNASDTEGNAYTTSTSSTGDYINNDDDFYIEKDNVTIEYFAGNGTNATIGIPALLILRVYDNDNQSYVSTPNASVSFNISKLGAGNAYTTMFTNNTNATGYVVYNFVADPSFIVARQSWLGFTSTADNAYQFNSSFVFNVTTRSNVPQLINVSVSPQTGGWGDQRTFNISFYDANDSATIYLWRASALAGPWVYISEKNYTAAGTTNYLNFVQTLSCDIQGTWFYKFNATNSAGNKNSTAEVATNNFTIGKDDVAWYYLIGQGSVQNRSGGQGNALIFQARDQNGTNLTNFAVEFSVTSDNSTYYTDAFLANKTNSTGFSRLNFNPTCLSEYSGAPKFAVGEQQWKVKVNDSELSCYSQNDSYSTIPRNLFVWGDIRPSVAKPKYQNEAGGQNFTQEATINFLGSTVDDCNDPLTLNITNTTKEVIFNMLHPQMPTNAFVCNITTELVGSNAYSCDFTTTITTNSSWYNVSFATNKSYYYANTTTKTGDPGVFHLDALKRLATPATSPTTEGWGRRNWNLSIVASSGDPVTVYNISLFMSQTPPPSDANKCDAPTCINGTSVVCVNCVDSQRYWLRNFTAIQQGTWYYRFQMKNGTDETLSSFDAGTHKITVEEDDVNVTYFAGDGAAIIKDTQTAIIAARVYDNDSLTYDLIPNATVTFKVRRVGFGAYTNGEKTIGTNYTNSTGHAQFNWNVTDCDWYEGSQNWTAEVADSEPYYKPNMTENRTLSITLTGCTASISATQILLPRETFQYRNFTINASVTASVAIANDVSATLIGVPNGWTTEALIKDIGSVGIGAVKDVGWMINATTYGEYNLSVFFNSSNAGNRNISSNNFTVYKERASLSVDGLPFNLRANEETIVGVSCEPGDYRLATLNISLNTSLQNSKLRVYVYNSTDWLDVLHSLPVNTSGNFIAAEIPVLKNQLYINESGKCNVKLKNVGNANINVSSLIIYGHYRESAKITDINAKVNDTIVTGIEPSESLFNASVNIMSSINVSYAITLTLNISNSTSIVNSSLQSATLPANGNLTLNFTNINTSTWNQGDYKLKAYLYYQGGNLLNETREENFVFRYVNLSIKSTSYMCNGTIEEYNVTLINPFSDSIGYNISLTLPSGWSYSGTQYINA
ncbi:MAG: hypothetical protein HY361_01625, partial [Candidatus Aenigmarchaeota archaeon]|nr:hypothetical protein [Candidatus Aenigmarchaeota archaeon]